MDIPLRSKTKFVKYVFDRHTSLDCTFKHARNAGFSNFCSITPREGKPRSQCKRSFRDNPKSTAWSRYMLGLHYKIQSGASKRKEK